MNQNQIRLMSDRKRPYVKLEGEDGNAFSILGQVRSALREVGWSKAEIGEVTDEMMSGDYDNLVATACKYCEVI